MYYNNPTIVCSQRRPSYYGDVFIANNKDVDYHMKTVYAKQPKSKVCQLFGMYVLCIVLKVNKVKGYSIQVNI